MRPSYDIVVCGSYFCDLVFTGLPGLPELGKEFYAPGFDIVVGGGAITTAIALRRLDVNVGLATTFGTDLFSDFVAVRLAAEGIDPALYERAPIPLRRITVALSYPADRAFVSYIDPAPSSVDRALSVLDRADLRHLHLPGLMIAPKVIDLLERCHARRITVSMDSQHRDDTLDAPLVREILSRVDIFMPNEAEAIQLTGERRFGEALKRLCELSPCVVIKRGADGAVARDRAGEAASPALPSEAIDTTGAGDAFNAGFLAARLAGQSLTDCLNWGNFCGGMSVRGLGGSTTTPTRAQLMDWLKANQAGRP